MEKLLRVVVFAFFAQFLLICCSHNRVRVKSPVRGENPVWREANTPVREVLDNGMTVVLLENHRAPVVTTQAWVGAGSVTEDEFSGSGISHFVEHMLFKGTARRSVGRIGQEVKEAGGHTNAYTGANKTVYYITFHSDHFDRALDIMADVLMHSVFDPEEIEREREVILREIEMNRDDPFRRLYRMAHQTAYAVHPYGNPVIGYENLLRGLTRDDLLGYYRKLYVPNNMVFVAVGDFDADEALPKIREAFRDYERTSIAPTVVPQEPAQKGPRERVEAFEVAVAQSMMGFHGPSLHSEDMYPMDVLAILLGGGDTSRLHKELREKRGLVYTITAWSATPPDPGMFWIASSFEPENHEAVTSAIWEQIEKLRSEGISEEELETARAKVLSDYIFSTESVEGQARSLGSGEFDAHDVLFDKRYVEAIGRVTAQDVTRVVEKYFRSENSVIAALMPARGDTPAKGITDEQEKEGTIPQIEKVVLPNGLTLLLREDHGAETIAIRLIVMGGARTENESNTGVTNLMSKAMLKGTATRSAEEIAWAIESRGGSIQSFSGYNSFGFELDMLSRDVEIGMGILGDIVANPSFLQEEVERERTAALASIKSVDDEIFPSSMRLFRRTMFEGHPYSFLVQGEADVLQTIMPEHLKRFHSEAAMASRMVLSVFGDIERSEVLESVKRNFGQLRKGTTLPAGQSSRPVSAEPRKASKPMNKEQLAILVGFPGVTVGDPDRYSLDVIASFLNSQGGKLFQTLRDERGLAYSVGAFNLLGLDPGAFVLYIVTEPGKSEEAIDGMFEVIGDLRQNGLDNEELARTKVEVMGNHAIGLQTNGQIATEVSFDELYGLDYNRYREYDSKIRAITAEDIRRVASDIFDLSRYTLVSVGNLGPEQ